MAEILTPDLCVIGGGTGGLAVAAAACAHDASVVLFERGKMGGGALNAASVPSTALIASARQAHVARTGPAFGVLTEVPRVHWRRLHDHVQQVMAGVAPERSAERYAALGVRIVQAEARFTDHRTVAAGDVIVRARRFVIATGSQPVVPQIPGLAMVPYFTSETIFDNTRKLTHLVVIGAGRLAAELGQAYHRLGSQVTVVAPGTLLPDADPELVEVALRRMQEEGVEIRVDTEVVEVQPRSQGIGVVLRRGDKSETIDASHILVATGRTPNLADLDLDKAGIRRARTDPARLQLSPGLRTSNRRVYAIGDAAVAEQTDRLADHHAGIVVRGALFGWPMRQRSDGIATAIHTDPEIASVGLTESAARRRFGDGIQVLRWAFAENDRARALRQTYGLAKLVTDRRGRILGAGIVGPEAAELIGLFSLAIANRISARQLRDLPLPYPALSEIANGLGAEFCRRQPGSAVARRLLAARRLLP